MKDDLIKRSDALNALDDVITVTGKNNADAVTKYISAVSKRLEAISAVDAVPVVRCKDCIRFDERRGCNLVEGLNMAKPDSYCSYGERREGEITNGF